MNITQLSTELQIEGDRLAVEVRRIKDSIPDDLRAEWLRSIDAVSSAKAGRWLYEQLDRLDASEYAAFFAAFPGGEDAADELARLNPGLFLSTALKTSLAVRVASVD